MSPALFALLIFGVRTHIFAWISLDGDSPVYASLVAEKTGTCHHVWLLDEMESH
jgi:hypothetical protein